MAVIHAGAGMEQLCVAFVAHWMQQPEHELPQENLMETNPKNVENLRRFTEGLNEWIAAYERARKHKP